MYNTPVLLLQLRQLPRALHHGMEGLPPSPIKRRKKKWNEEKKMKKTNKKKNSSATIEFQPLMFKISFQNLLSSAFRFMTACKPKRYMWGHLISNPIFHSKLEVGECQKKKFGSEFRISGSLLTKYRISNTEFWILNSEFQIPNVQLAG